MPDTRRRVGRRCAVALVALLPVQLVGLRGDEPGPEPATSRAATRPVADPGSGWEDRSWTRPAAAPAELAAGPATSPAIELVTEPDLVTGPAPAPAVRHSPPVGTFAARYPDQVAAVQDFRPASTRWALLIGVNEHLGRVSDNIGSRQDAEDLRAQLLAHGWLDDHILLITDRDATRTNIIAGMRWLSDKTDPASLAIFHYSGHSKKWYGRDIDGDGEPFDVGLWPTDDRYIPDAEVVRELAGVEAFGFWVSFATCNAAGFDDPGLARPGRVLTFSSREDQKSYENPAWGNSVWGFHMIEEAMVEGRGDLDGDGRVTVQEAFTWARPRAHQTTRGQTDGTQDAVMIDDLDGQFDLVIPDVAPPRPRRSPHAAPAQAAPEQPPGRESDEPDEPDADDDDGICVLLCGR